MRPAAAACLVAFALGLAGCGTEASGSGTTEYSAAPGTVAPTSSNGPATSLTVEVAQSGFDLGVSVTTTLECDPVGGTNPLQAESCAELAAHPASLEPVPPDTACTMIFGGPEEAHVYGTFQGEDVDSTFNRTNGCEIERWDSLEPLFKVVVD